MRNTERKTGVKKQRPKRKTKKMRGAAREVKSNVCVCRWHGEMSYLRDADSSQVRQKEKSSLGLPLLGGMPSPGGFRRTENA